MNDSLWLKEVRYLKNITECLTSGRGSGVTSFLSLMFTAILNQPSTAREKSALVVIPTMSMNHAKFARYSMF